MKKIMITGDNSRAAELQAAFSLLGLTVSVEKEPTDEQLKHMEMLIVCLPAEKQSAERSITEMEDWEGAEALYDRWACGLFIARCRCWLRKHGSACGRQRMLPSTGAGRQAILAAE